MSKPSRPHRLFHSHLHRVWLPMLKPSSDTVQLLHNSMIPGCMMCKKRSCEKSCWGLPCPCLQALFKLQPPPLALAWAILQLCPSLAVHLADLDPDSLDCPETTFITANLSGSHWTVGWPNSHWTCSAFLVQVLCPLSASTSPLPALLSPLAPTCGAAIAHCSDKWLSSLVPLGTSCVSTFQDSCFLFRTPCLVLADTMTWLDNSIFIHQ